MIIYQYKFIDETNIWSTFFIVNCDHWLIIEKEFVWSTMTYSGIPSLPISPGYNPTLQHLIQDFWMFYFQVTSNLYVTKKSVMYIFLKYYSPLLKIVENIWILGLVLKNIQPCRKSYHQIETKSIFLIITRIYCKRNRPSMLIWQDPIHKGTN